MNIDRVKIDENGKPYSERIRKNTVERMYGEIRKCQHCKVTFFAQYRKIKIGGGKFCSNKCQITVREPNAKHINGKLINENGYVIVKVKNVKRMKSGYSYEHRVVAEAKLGRPLMKGEIVHHIDGNKLNNHPDNLLIMNQGDHIRLHFEQRRKFREALNEYN